MNTTMEVEPISIVSLESYEKFGLSDSRRVSNERVKDFLDRGLMSKGDALVLQPIQTRANVNLL